MTRADESTLTYVAGDVSYRGLLLDPPRDRPTAMVVLLPDWRGQSVLAREHADFLVSAGCTVLVADLYGNGWNPTDPDDVGPLVQRLIDDRAVGVAALAACVEELRRLSDAPLVCLGYSAGAMVALDYARSSSEPAGVILCSGLLKTATEGMNTSISAPVLILQGTQDQVSPVSTIAEVIAEMDAAGNDARFELYTQTHHAFDNPDAGTDPTSRLVYSPTSADRARTAIARFVRDVSGNG